MQKLFNQSWLMTHQYCKMDNKMWSIILHPTGGSKCLKVGFTTAIMIKTRGQKWSRAYSGGKIDTPPSPEKSNEENLMFYFATDYIPKSLRPGSPHSYECHHQVCYHRFICFLCLLVIGRRWILHAYILLRYSHTKQHIGKGQKAK